MLAGREGGGNVRNEGTQLIERITVLRGVFLPHGAGLPPRVIGIAKKPRRSFPNSLKTFGNRYSFALNATMLDVRTEFQGVVVVNTKNGFKRSMSYVRRGPDGSPLTVAELCNQITRKRWSIPQRKG